MTSSKSASRPRVSESCSGSTPRRVPAAASAWSDAEQAGTRAAAPPVAAALADANRAYEARFGFIFILCATGLSADEMLAALQRRLGNAPEVERRIAAEEQRKIMLLRLEKLVAGVPNAEVTR